MNRQKNFDKYIGLRNKYQNFYYNGFDFVVKNTEIQAKFHFAIENEYFFEPVVTFQTGNFSALGYEKDIEILLFHVGLVELISYWKAACPPIVHIKPFVLTEDQIQWWKKLWFNGLGELFWLNSIETSSNDFMNVVCDGEAQFEKIQYKQTHQHGVIVPVGGGKDSAVSLEFFKYLNIEQFPMLVNPRAAMTETVDAAGISKPNCFVTSRSIDPQLLSLNNEGFLNGHTPFSSLLAFQSLVYSLVSGIKDIALSNESSANEATVPGTNINHQYSKSLEFESDFRNYVHSNLSKSFNYYSVLRPLSELQIAYAFQTYKHHLSVFKSCNVGSKQNIWCGKCPKCLFTAIMLLPFIGLDRIEQIFGYQIFNNEQLTPIFDQLIGKHQVKPFECVGTPHEIQMALNFFILHTKMDNALPHLIEYFKKSSFYKNIEENEFWNTLKNSFDSEHFLSNPLYEQLQQYIRSL